MSASDTGRTVIIVTVVGVVLYVGYKFLKPLLSILGAVADTLGFASNAIGAIGSVPGNLGTVVSGLGGGKSWRPDPIYFDMRTPQARSRLQTGFLQLQVSSMVAAWATLGVDYPGVGYEARAKTIMDRVFASAASGELKDVIAKLGANVAGARHTYDVARRDLSDMPGDAANTQVLNNIANYLVRRLWSLHGSTAWDGHL
jgi:hypothetical protein